MKLNIVQRVQKHRIGLRASGLRPVQIWVPDTRNPEFADECSRQSRLVSKSDAGDNGMLDLMEAALNDVDGWSA